jgi:prolyl-tRNA editing enzyme YbaK/EbsC (Cys-tRNA(Pro) deacylase)
VNARHLDDPHRRQRASFPVVPATIGDRRGDADPAPSEGLGRLLQTHLASHSGTWQETNVPPSGIVPAMAVSKSTRRVMDALEAHGLDAEVRDMPGSTRTAQDAAAAVGCEVGQIVKSLVFSCEDGGVVLVLASGPNRVDLARLATHLGSPVSMADPATVRAATGFAIGGVAPVGLPNELPVLMDADLLRYDTVWAAAGTPRSVFPVAPDVLRDATGATVVAVHDGG